ncbi:arsenic resistance protein [Actinoplanes rectilineatus]|uniref:arsenic resistance protein n=1 Tax=Actinoplanes rectilineatus TaxID=113571 RepID=UPI0005F27A2E|nr:arsenic resistance protein [Actinoplanes rectilineatus]
MERRQIPLYLVAIAAGAVTGLVVPQAAPALGHAVTPVLALLLFATFLGVPLAEIGRSVRDVRFLGTVLGVNFLAVPLLAAGLSRFVADDRALMLGVLLVLLTPCIDYVIVFTGLAGGARARLLAATPLLMAAQTLLLPVYLVLFAGQDALAAVEPGPFTEAFLVLIVLPLAAAAIVQARRARRVEQAMAAAMVPLMMLTLAVVVGSQIAAVGAEATVLLRVVPLYAVFTGAAVLAGRVAARVARLDVPATRAVMFSAATRNSLVVLPLALALPPELRIAALAVVTQTLVELIAMVVLIRLVPRITTGDSTPVAA